MNWWEKFFDEYYPEVYANREALTSKEVEGVLKILKLKTGKKLLDLCCGYGRHSLVLAQKGFKVTSYDLSSYLLEKAKKQADSLRLKVKFVQGDMRKIPFKNEFDSVINMFTSFGFFPKEKDNSQVLRGVNQALKEKGVFLLDTANREFVLKNYRRRRWVPQKGFLMLEDTLFDPFTSRWESTRTLVFEDRPRRKYFFSLRLYTLTEMISNFKKAGFVIEQVYGDFDLNEYSLDSPRMIILAKKAS